MNIEAENYIDLLSAFDRFFQNSKQAVCLWDEEKKMIMKVNQTFLKGLNDLNISSKMLMPNNFIDIHQSKIRKTLIEENMYLLECDQLLFRELNKTQNDYEQIEEERAHATVHAEELGIKLEQSQKQFRKIARIAPTGIIFTDTDFKITWSNNKGFDLFGSEDILNKSLGDLIYVREVLHFYEKLDKLKNSDQPVKFKFSINNLPENKEFFINCYGISFIGHDLHKTFVFILEDHTENVQYSEEITNRNIELTQINNELDKFLYSVSHNIRGPVSSLQGLLSVIEISDVATVNELKHHLRLNLRLLKTFVEDITNVAENIHTDIKKESVQLHMMLEKNIDFFAKIYKLNPQVSFSFDPDYIIKTDPDRLNIILKNVLKNCFQYQDKDKTQFEITVKAELLNNFHYIEICDNGTGIQKEVLPKIFDMFYRGSELSSGNGMGLYNSREILKKMGGRINIRSWYRKRTAVKIYLPVESEY